jgi:class 3 adenylate cyclase
MAVRIGMHCGYVAQANLGNYVRRDFTLIGDTVNTTQRLESAAKPNSILMSEDFRKQLNLSNTNGTEFTFSKKMFLKAKNKAEMIPVFLVSRN